MYFFMLRRKPNKIHLAVGIGVHPPVNQLFDAGGIIADAAYNFIAVFTNLKRIDRHSVLFIAKESNVFFHIITLHRSRRLSR